MSGKEVVEEELDEEEQRIENMTVFGKFKASVKELLSHPVGFWATSAAMFRYIGIFASDFYAPLYFLRSYPQHVTTFMTVYPLMVLCGGFCSALIGGIICDRFGKSNPMTKTIVCVIGNALAAPMFITAVSLKGKFFLPALCLIGGRFLCGEVWKAPNLTIM